MHCTEAVRSRTRERRFSPKLLFKTEKLDIAGVCIYSFSDAVLHARCELLILALQAGPHDSKTQKSF